MAALGDISTAIIGDELPWFSYTIVGPLWPDISLAVPQDTGSGSGGNSETFSAYVAG